MSDNRHIQESIERESIVYKDIIQYTEEFPDHSNLTVKTSVAAQWVSEFCPQTKFVLVADDNVIVDIFKLLPFLREQLELPVSNSIALCHYRSSTSEMLGARQEAVADTDRHFCSNEAYVVSPSVLDQLYLTVKLKGMNVNKQERLWLSEIAEAAGVTYTNTCLLYTSPSPRD